MTPAPNIPLLRKAVEWAEAEAAKPTGGLWDQSLYFRDTPCGTAYCIAGYAMSVQPGYAEVGGWPTLDGYVVDFWREGQRLLSLTEDEADALFDGYNDISDVRRVAEEIAARAGERL